MILQTGMRTDIPAFYSEWFANRLREGFVMVRNPYNPTSVTRYRISPDVVDLIAFCTKNPAPMLKRADLLAPYGQYWFVTITPYGREIEPHVPDKRGVVADFIRLSETLGADCVGWRYDPIFISEKYSLNRHIEAFSKMAQALSGRTHVCVISFIDLYEKVRRNFPEARNVSRYERAEIAKAFVEIGARHNITVKACAEGTELAQYGVDCGGCLTLETYEAALGERLILPKRKSQRRECACFFGSDIGAYDSCGHLCRYCYANSNAYAVRQNMKNHDPDSPLLIGHLNSEDVVHEAKQSSLIDYQLHF